MAGVGGRAADRDATRLMSVASTDREPSRWAVLALLSVAQLMGGAGRDDRDHRDPFGTGGAAFLHGEPADPQLSRTVLAPRT